MIEVFNVEHHEHLTDKPFEAVMASFYAATGSVEGNFAEIVQQTTSVEDFKRVFQEREGTSGFMRFMVANHGEWLGRFIDRPVKAVMVVLGNPLVAITMLEHDVRAGLNVPVRIFIYEGSDGKTRVAYDVPSTLMGDLNDTAKAAASKLDMKLTALITEICAPVAS